jgi:hypothetical protein
MKLLAMLWDGFRAIALRPPRLNPVEAGPGLFLALVVAYCAVSLALDMIDVARPWRVVSFGITTLLADSLLTLAAAWLCFAALGWRAVRNRRFQSHSQWMVRSYVLVWSFVFCRIASRFVPMGEDAFIWLSWVGPLLVCEMVLQWPEGARKLPRRAEALPRE